MSSSSLRSKLISYLSRIGPARATDIHRHLAISQPAFSRLVEACRAELLIIGRARKTRYAARRSIPTVGTTIALYAIGKEGEANRVALLHAVHPRGFWIEPEDDRLSARLHDDLPYFLYDQRPAGYLGRLIPQRHPELDLPEAIDRWSGDHCLRYFAQYGWNLPGNLIVGDQALERYLEQKRANDPGIADGDRAKVYPDIVDNLLEYGPAGSSAGGEQPKFLVTRQRNRAELLVKFTPTMDSRVGRRWADLLICEHVGHQILAKHQFRSPRSELLESANRLFLEVERFDRTPSGGRRGALSLIALDPEFVGSNLTSWGRTVTELHHQGRVNAQALRTTAQLELFGRLIANTDMHLGNLTFIADGDRLIEIAPAYDMVPMLFAPQHDQIVNRRFVPPTPKVAQASIWEGVHRAAVDFWSSVAEHPRLSVEFASIAEHCANAVRSLEEVAALLPK